MRKIALLAACAASACFAGAPLRASIMVIGGSPGHACYESARAKNGSPQALKGCNSAFESGLMTFYDQVATYVNRGIVHLHGGRHQEAVADFDRAIALDPEQPESYLNKGSALLRMGANPSEAIPLLNEALRRNTTRPELAYYSRAVAHEVSGNLQEAYRDYQRAQAAAPRWEQPRLEMSRFQVKRVGRSKM